MLLVVASLSVAIVAFIVYALERRAKEEPIIWEHAGKLSLFGGIVTAGILFVSNADTKAVAETIASIEMPSTQDMFVGTPSF
jgi:hypothetical protein